jgi:hypothetical protein
VILYDRRTRLAWLNRLVERFNAARTVANRSTRYVTISTGEDQICVECLYSYWQDKQAGHPPG